ncbi:putative interleukin-17 receptor E-like isoform X3 [Scophthalmus maximus]|uniref:putative interleukin-17 receptor E-like isoform X3 n=1 Tax=Scophthalmus maximus TaxID=52904 RepID=UPI0015E0F7CC|nr:putative interleukin-17 receptor E-like isoform X3 [Scophthalmus maximus]
MILWAVLLLSHCRLGPSGAAAESTGLERIGTCGTRCSQGLHCKVRPDCEYRHACGRGNRICTHACTRRLIRHDLFPPQCLAATDALNTSSVFHNISLSTVMRCEGRQKCSLHLRMETVLQLAEPIRGLSICTATAGMMVNCQIFSFTRSSRERMSGSQVEVEHDCTTVSPNQRVQVMVKTVPSYCDITWSGTYDAPDCSSGDLRRHVPECITGRLSYDVNPEKRELSVSVSEMLDDHNYHLRLCYKDFICSGAGPNALIKKEEPVKSATLPYSQPLPCLCIEGWSAVMDAPRVQLCPFKDRLEELWFGVAFDPLEETLSWELVCPVPTGVALCQKRGDGVCVDLPQAFRNVTSGKVAFTEVDPHPQLCMKFTVGSQSWTRCPFADDRFQDQSSPPRSVVVRQTSRDMTWVIVPVGVCLSGIIMATLVLHVLLTVYQRRKQKEHGNEKQTDPALDCVVPALQAHPHGGILVPDSPQCGNAEKANLISQ